MAWIKRSDRQPTEDGPYLALTPAADPDKPCIQVAWYNPGMTEKGLVLGLHGWQLFPVGFKVTHWLPLPAPPEDE